MRKTKNDKLKDVNLQTIKIALNDDDFIHNKNIVLMQECY